jgi:hypothetical protein
LKIIIKNAQDKTNLTVEKKEFNLHDDHDTFFATDSQQVNKQIRNKSITNIHLSDF